jgi:hypothetical protein
MASVAALEYLLSGGCASHLGVFRSEEPLRESLTWLLREWEPCSDVATTLMSRIESQVCEDVLSDTALCEEWGKTPLRTALHARMQQKMPAPTQSWVLPTAAIFGVAASVTVALVGFVAYRKAHELT